MPVSSLSGNKARNVLVLGNVRSEGLSILEDFADLTVLPGQPLKDDILACIGDMDAVLHKVGKIDAEIISRQTKLRLIARHGVGLDDLDLPSVSAAGIPVSTTQNANSNAVAEATVGLALSLLRNFRAADTMIRKHRSWARESFMGRELKRSTAGIVGFGNIGRLVADYFAAFGTHVIVCDSEAAVVADSPYPAVSLEELLSNADIVTLHCPLTPENNRLMNEDRLNLLQEHAVLINTARGGLVDQNALAAAAAAGKIGGAALDVFDREPPDFDHPVFSCPNIIVTPHIAAMTFEAQVAMAVNAATEIRRVLVEGLPPTNSVTA